LKAFFIPKKKGIFEHPDLTKNIIIMNKVFLFVLLTASFVLQGACQSNSKKEVSNLKNQTPVQVKSQDGFKRAYFASGCFWCVEAIYESVKGVKESISGYSGGHTKKPTYEESNTGRTGHAEAVEIIYDPNIISFKVLVDIYFASQNITQINGQGNDIGSQYRSILFYQNDEEKKIIDEKISVLNKQLKHGKVAAEVMPFQKFWIAEDYHQNYEKLNPNNPYIQNVSIPRLNRFKKNFPDLLKDKAQH